jgi:hypothetical protein
MAQPDDALPFPALLSTLKSQELKDPWRGDVATDQSQDRLWTWVRLAEFITRYREVVSEGADAKQLAALHHEIEVLASELNRVAEMLACLSRGIRQLHLDIEPS